jgi:hypothetical protein
VARPSFLRRLVHTCTIQRFVAAGADDYNQPSGSWSDVATGVACLVQQKRTLQTTGRRPGLTEEVLAFQGVMFCDYGTNVREGDRVTGVVYEGTTTPVRLDTQGNAVSFTVVEVIDAGGQRHHYEVKLKAVGS